MRFGRIGSAGQTQVKQLASAEAAIAALDKLVWEKRAKGYVEVGGAAASAEARALRCSTRS